MILYINGSPKKNKSNSYFFLSKVSKTNKIYDAYKDNPKTIDFKNIDTFVLSFPLYVDSPPNKILELFEYIIKNKINMKNKSIYVICNSGFLEYKHIDMAIDIVKNFSRKVNANFKGSFKIGAGEIIGKREKNKLYKLVSLKFNKLMHKFNNSINENKECDLHMTLSLMTKRLYVFLANINWKKDYKVSK